MTYYLQHGAPEHLAILASTLQAWAAQDRDLFLVSREGHRLYTSSRLLALSSPTIASLLPLSPSTTPGLSLPCSSATLSSLLTLLTSGSAPSSPLEEVQEAATCLGISLNLHQDGVAVEEEREEVANMRVFAARSSSSSLSILSTSQARKKVKVSPPGPMVKEEVAWMAGVHMEEPVEEESAAEEESAEDPTMFDIREEKPSLGKVSRNRQKTNPERPFTCQFCPKTFKKMKQARRHKQRAHPTSASKGDVACGFCPRFLKQNHMLKHVQVKHPEEVENMPTQTVVTKEEDGNEASKGAKCNLCPKAFAGQDYLERHILVKHSGKPGKNDGDTVTEWQCDQCQKYLGSRNALKNHMPIHMPEKPFKCNDCEKEFTQKGNLKTHIERYHTSQEVSFGNLKPVKSCF